MRVWVFMCRRWVYGGREHLDLPLAQRSHVRSLCCARGARLSHARACVAARASDGGGVYQTDLRESCTVESVARGVAHAHASARAHARTRAHTLHRQSLRSGPPEGSGPPLSAAGKLVPVWQASRPSALHAAWQVGPASAAPVSIRRPHSRVPRLGTRLDGLRLGGVAVCSSPLSSWRCSGVPTNCPGCTKWAWFTDNIWTRYGMTQSCQWWGSQIITAW